MDVLVERLAQDSLWGRGFSERMPEQWLAILVEEVGEAAESMVESNSQNVRRELVQVAAVAMSALTFMSGR